ncbi:MAG: ATP-grasp domain-containing protein, partial [Candidatus Nitrotoga sp.]
LVGGNILDALAGRRDEVEVFATNSAASGCFLEDFDGVFLTPQTLPDTLAFEARFVEVFDELQPDLVIPCRDDDVVFLAEFGRKRHDLANRLLCGSPEFSRVAHDKHLSWRFSIENGLPFAPTLATPAGRQETLEFAENHGFPLLVKPLVGFASRDVWLVMDEAQLLRAAQRPGFLIQHFLGQGASVASAWSSFVADGLPLFHSFEGLKHSIQIMIGPGGECAGVFCSVNVNRYGTSLSLERHDDPDAIELGRRCAEVLGAAGWRGPVNIQCQKTPGGTIYIYEYNARFSGATAARCCMGYDEVGLVISLFTGRRITPPVVVPGSGSVTRVALDRMDNQQVNSSLIRSGSWLKGHK